MRLLNEGARSLSAPRINMRIKTVAIKGYCGFSAPTPLRLDDLGHRNVLIGPNNAGKSTALRFLDWVATYAQKNTTWLTDIHENQISPPWWHKSETNGVISADIDFSELPADLLSSRFKHVSLHVDGVARMTVSLSPQGRSWQLCIAPALWNGSGWNPVALPSPEGSNRPQFLTASGYTSDAPPEVPPWDEACRRFKERFSRSFFRLQAIRAVDYESTDETFDLGNQSLIEELHAWEQNPQKRNTWQRFHSNIVRQLNELLTPSQSQRVIRFSTAGTRVNRNPAAGSQNRLERLQIFVDTEGHSLPLENLGTGVADAIVLLAALERRQSSIFLLEEPECHLHPGMLRRLMNMLGKKSNVQLLISSHSNVILDSLDAKDRVFRFWEEEGQCQVEPTSNALKFHDVLDDLGITNSSLLQPNCILWVEGPSDRIYLREWIRLRNETLQEGVNFAFLYYGGRILSHHSLSMESEDSDELIAMLRVCRYACVLMDRDKPEGATEQELTRVKQRILEEAALQPGRCLALATPAREIEHCVQPELLRLAFTRLLRLEPALLSEWAPTGGLPILKEVAQYLDGKGVTCSLPRSLNKVGFARTIMTISKETAVGLVTPAFVDDVVALIVRASAH